jgi:hypothetical protein
MVIKLTKTVINSTLSLVQTGWKMVGNSSLDGVRHFEIFLSVYVSLQANFRPQAGYYMGP